jgi:hypothetical protein
MEKLLKTVAAAGILTTTFMQPAYAALIEFKATLNAVAENNPADTSTGTGLALVTLDTTANTMAVNITYTGLTSAATGAHIHCCLASPFASGNVNVATTTPAFPGFVLGFTSGTYSNTMNMLDPGSYNLASNAILALNGNNTAIAESVLFTAIEDGETYLNIHTSVNPGGEIRGFLVPVPEPVTLSVFGAGLAGTVAMRRRKKVKV